MHGVWGLLSATFNEWMEDKAPRLGAALAYYTAFSIAPLLILLVASAGLVVKGDTTLQAEGQIAAIAGDNAAEAIGAIIRGAKASGGGRGATIFSVVTLLIGATGAFGQLQDAMNTIWEVTPEAAALLGGHPAKRLLSFVMVVAVGIILLASLFLSAFLATASHYFQHRFPLTGPVWPLADLGLSFVTTTLLFAAIFKILPDVDIAWRDVWLGAAVTAALFAAGKIGIGLYLGRSSFKSVYGAAGSFLVLLAWVYYSAQILFFGAEFTQVHAARHSCNVPHHEGAHHDQRGRHCRIKSQSRGVLITLADHLCDGREE